MLQHERTGPVWQAARYGRSALGARVPSIGVARGPRLRLPRQHLVRVLRHYPDLQTDEFAFLNRPGRAETQVELFCDYRKRIRGGSVREPGHGDPPNRAAPHAS
ncbi:hypothetical protein [Streptomyces sp. NPDC001401]|uniref:hypothetical protein n=1 Tax=Streptomyces sp. NPDC001401 TaxID=3364570 RepID=UPI0036B3D70A